MKVAMALIFCLCASICYSQTPEYDMTIRISPDEKRMEVAGELVLPSSTTALEKIDLALNESMEDFAAEIPGSRIVKTEKKLRPWANPGWGTNTWSLVLEKPIPANSKTSVKFRYSYNGSKPGFILSLSTSCVFGAGTGSAWYPQVEQSPRTDDGLRLRGLHGTGVLRFKIPKDWEMYALGSRTTSDGMIQYTIEQPAFFSFTAAKFSVMKAQSPLRVQILELQPRGPRMEEYMSKSARILEILTAEFGPYPYPDFAIVEVPTEEASAAGFAGASLEGFILATSEFLDQKFNTAYFGHEIGHQWWGLLVRSEELEGRWLLSEGMAQYGSVRAVEIMEGEEVAEAYRRRGYPGYIQDQSGFGALMVAAAGHDRPLFDLPNDGSLSRWLADSKGFMSWEMLSREIGREKFSSVLKFIVANYAGKRVSWKQFKSHASEVAKQDLSPYFEQWFERAGIPEWKFEWTQKDRMLTIQLQPSNFVVTLDVEITGENDQKVLRQGNTRQASWQFEVPFDVKNVRIDPRFRTLHFTEDYRKETTAIAPFTSVALLLNDGKADEAFQALEPALSKVNENDAYGLPFLLHSAMARILYDKEKYSEARKHVEKALSMPVKRSERLPWVYFRLAEIADKENNAEAVCSALRSLVAADQNAVPRTSASELIGDLHRKHHCPS